MKQTICLLLLSGFIAATTPATAEFVDGDLYILKIYAGSWAILQLDPISGAPTFLTNTLPVSHGGSLAYDPFRDVLLYSAGSNPIGGLNLVQSDGTSTSLPGVQTARNIAPRGDGIVYLFRTGSEYVYLDAQNVQHDLLDADDQPFTLTATDWDEMYYDASSNALLLARAENSALATLCPLSDQACVVRLPLDATGTRVVGSITSSQIDIVPGIAEDNVVGMGPGPNGNVAFVVDTNSNNQEPRMQLLDPAALSFTTWASNGFYIGAAVTIAGLYVPERDQFVVYDSHSDHLRAFSLGEIGGGTAVGPGLSGPGGLASRLRQVRRNPVAAPVTAESERAITVSPNPAYGVTTLAFRATETGMAQIRIYDVLGRRVRELTSSVVEDDLHSIAWNGRDDLGAKVVPGVYYVRVTTAGGARSAKIVWAP